MSALSLRADELFKPSASSYAAVSRVASLRLVADLKELRGLSLQLYQSEGLTRYQTASFGRPQIRYPVTSISVVRKDPRCSRFLYAISSYWL
jgi:hypothetical protein